MEINIPENPKKGKRAMVKNLFGSVIIILTGVGAYGVGKLEIIEKNRVPVTVEYPEQEIKNTASQPTTTIQTSLPKVQSISIIKQQIPTTQPISTTTNARTTGLYVAARGGTVYYLPTCSGARRISEKNKIWFDSKAEAEKFGYKPAKNCNGP